MKLMFASDIHGSAYYCRELIRAYKEENADRLLLLGDILYHGPRNDLPRDYAPKEVIGLLNDMRSDILCVRGNCDTEVDQMVLSFPLLADYAAVLDEGRVLYLTHGHIYNEQHLPPVQPGDAVLYGHTHIPVMHRVDDISFVNPGSVSIPKAGSTRGYVIYEAGCFSRRDLTGCVESEFVL